MEKETLKQYRFFLKDTIRKLINFRNTDQNLGKQPPPTEKPVNENALIYNLSGRDEWLIPKKDLTEAISDRKSHRKYKNEPLREDELSYLLWATQGIRKDNDRARSYRNVPSAGCRHSFETYVAILNIEGFKEGIYRYLPLSHKLTLVSTHDYLPERLVKASLGQPYPGNAALTFIWTTIPLRMEWRYSLAAHKVIAIDSGHMCQNLYLACEAIGAGTCAIAAYDQEEMDKLIGVDGEEEFTIYLAPVGRV